MVAIKLKNTKLNTPNGRLRFIRSLAGFTRNEIEQAYKLPEVTLRKWETGKISLSKKGGVKCIEIYKKENVICTEQWLFEGVGPRPYLAIEFGDTNESNDSTISCFQKIYHNCIILKITTEVMLPQYKPNEIVIGDAYRGDIKNLHNRDCIVLLNTDELILRKLIYTDDNNISLMCTNPSASKKPILHNVKIKYLSPVLWHKIEP